MFTHVDLEDLLKIEMKSQGFEVDVKREGEEAKFRVLVEFGSEKRANGVFK